MYPLPARAGGILFQHLGDLAEQRILADKEAAAKALSAIGIPIPQTAIVIRQGAELDENAAVWQEPAELFVKPRRGSGGLGSRAVSILGGGRYSWGSGEPENWESFSKKLAAAVALDDLLVQERITASPEWRDLAPEGRAPVIRLTTARERGGDAFLHSALLVVAVPGESPRNLLRGQVFYPVDLQRGEWGEERRIAGWTDAAAVGLAAMRLFPGLPLVTWDVIPGERRPVLLEGNTAANWFLTIIPERSGLAAPLEPLLARWAWGVR
ncbi:MAG: sugar-transfer associated ATP-grasp domain-containing protein [Acidobacteriota bacterium]